MSGFRKPSGCLPALTRAELMRAHIPAQTGALQLVPPICRGLPFSTISAPKSGSAVALTSGTSLRLPLILVPACHLGRRKYMLMPPPPEDQPPSLATVPSAASSKVVPPTATTHGSVDSYSACSGPVARVPV